MLGVIGISLHVAIMLWRLHHSYFFADDFMELEQARTAPLGLRYLARDGFGQVAPLKMFSHWLLSRLVGLNFTVAKGLMIAASASSVAFVAATSARARTPPPVAAGCVLAAALCWLAIEPDRWWANGILVAPGTLFALAALWICANPVAQLTWPDRALLGLALVAASAFYNKEILLVPVCGAARLYVTRSLSASPRKSFWRDALQALSDCSIAIAGAVSFGLFVLSVKLSEHAAPSSIDPALAARALGIGIQFGWVTGVLGLRTDSGAPPLMLAQAAAVADVIAVAVVIAAVFRARFSVWLWLGLFGFVAVSTLIIASQRVSAFGVWTTATPRYHTDDVFLTFAIVTMAFGLNYHASPEPRPAVVRPGWLALLGGSIAMLLQFVGGLHYPDPLGMDPSHNRVFIKTLRRAAAALAQGETVGDRQMPEQIVGTWMQPYNDLSQLATILRVRLPLATWDVATHYMDDDGRLHAFSAAPRRKFTDMDGRQFELAMAAPIEDAGQLDRVSADRAAGWFNTFYAPESKVRIALVSGDRILAWTDREDRPDIASRLNRASLTQSGFTAALPRAADREQLEAIAVIANRIGMVIPRGADAH